MQTPNNFFLFIIMLFKKWFFYALLALTLTNCTPIRTAPPALENTLKNSPNDLLTLLDPDTKTIDQAFLKAKESLTQGNTNRALFYFSKVLQRDKNNMQALLGMAIIYSKQKKHHLLKKIYHDILIIDKNNSIANEYIGLKKLKESQIKPAKAHLTRAIKNNTNQWKSHNALGIIADLEKDHITAMHHYSQALAVKPNNPMLLNNLGYSHYLNGSETTATQYFTQVLSINDKHQRAIYNLALIEIKKQQYINAAHLFNQIIKPYQSYNNIGYISMLDGNYAIAEKFYKKAISLSPYYFPAAQKNLNALQDLRFQSTIISDDKTIIKSQKSTNPAVIQNLQDHPVTPATVLEKSGLQALSTARKVKSKEHDKTLSSELTSPHLIETEKTPKISTPVILKSIRNKLPRTPKQTF